MVSTNHPIPMNHQPKRTIKVKNGGSAVNGGGGAVPDEVLEVNLIGENGPENVSGEFAEFLETSQLSDLVIRCSDGRFIECHRLLLAARARNLRHFMSASGQFNLTELVFRNCVKFEHIQALVSLIYRGHINGQDHQITSTLWKLFKIFGIRVTAKCFKNSSSGSKELAHELKYDSVELNAEKGAAKFEKIIREFRSETRKRTRRRPSATTENADKSGVETGKTKSRKTATRPPGVIVISDEEQEEWSSASCSSSVSSLSSSSSDGESAANPQRVIQGRGQQTNGKARGGGGGAAILSMNSNSAIKTNKAHKSEVTSTLVIQEVKSAPELLPGNEDWDSSGSSEGEYVESYCPPQKKKQKPNTPANRQPACLEYNQNEMTITVKSLAEQNNQEALNNVTPTKTATNPVKDTESEAIICSPQILFNIKAEPIDDEDEEDEEHEMGMLDEVDVEHFGHHIKMEIEEDENYEQSLMSQDRSGRRLPPPLLIPLQSTNRQSRMRHVTHDDDDSNSSPEPKQYVRDGKLEQFIMNCRPDSKPPPNFPPFTLRNPRGNQQRTYTTDNLWSALMDVKGGESIYRASQQHKVPRKTLRNWMKRCSIKSAYPMPSQLKEAAEKKKMQKYTY